MALGDRLVQHGAIGRAEELGAAGQAPDRRTHEQLERHGRRDRISGQPEDENRGAATGPGRGSVGQGLSRLHGDPPEIDPTDRFHGRLHDVVRPHRDPAGHDQGVGPDLDAAAQSLQNVIQVVRRDPEVDGLRAGCGDLGAQTGAIGVGDTGRPQRVTWTADLVARGQHADPWPSVHHESLDTSSGGKGNHGSADRRAGVQQRGAGSQVAPRRTDGAS